MAIDKRTRENIEACRPESLDLHSPDLNELARKVRQDPAVRAAYERVQQSDAAIVAAMPQVPVPAGLAERLLEQLAVAAVPAAAGSTASEVSVSAWRSHWPRRRVLGTAAALAATVLVAVGIGWMLQPGAPDSLEMLAIAWQQELAVNWQAMDGAPRDLVVPSSITASPVGWQRVRYFANGGGVAYKLIRGKARQAMLFVVKLSAHGLPGTLPAAPQSTTGGVAIGYWQSGGRIYVLIVEGDERSYRSFVETPLAPVA